MDGSNLIRCCLFLQLAASALHKADAACTVPDRFRTTSWIDSVKGDVHFTTWEVKNWTFSVNSMVVEKWEVADETKFETYGYVAYRSPNTFKVGTQTYYSFLCLKYEKLSAYVYRYFILHDISNLTDGERVLVSKTEDLWRFSDICNLSYVVDRSIFNLMISPGKGTEFSVECPQSILGNFKSSVYLPGTIACGGSDLTLDTCTNKTSLWLNSTDCSLPVAYSANGSLSCLTSEKIGSYYYSYVYNHDDTVDNNSTFRISCVVSDKDGKHMSIAPMRCQPGQTPFHIPVDHRGNKIGMLIINSVNFRCPGDEDKKDHKGLKKWHIISIVVSSGLVFMVVVYVCRRRRRSRN